MPASPTPRILVVDDEAAQMRALCDTLRDHGYETVGFTEPAAALEAARDAARDAEGVGRFALLLADLTMPGMDGIALLAEARQADPDLVGIIMTGKGTIASAVEAMKGGAFDYILKPFKLSAILPVLARALAMRELRVANAALEQSVRERTSELEAANKELEAFAASVSHDLRSPLSGILGNADMLTDYAARLPAETLPLVNDIIASAERMKQLIEDLLRLSRLGRQALEKRAIDVAALVGEVLRELAPEPGARQAELRLGALGECVGDPGLLKQVFANLLSNAFKFSRGTATPIVEVSCRLEAGQRIYVVRDNGAGFDMRHAAQLFGAFQRLHSAEQFEGTGVGLSIVHRIVERHGGRVWAEAEPGKGATFSFSLPE
jgi:signal transduction histidine kinase